MMRAPLLVLALAALAGAHALPTAPSWLGRAMKPPVLRDEVRQRGRPRQAPAAALKQAQRGARLACAICGCAAAPPGCSASSGQARTPAGCVRPAAGLDLAWRPSPHTCHTRHTHRPPSRQAAALPVVLWHGMGDSCCGAASVGALKTMIEEELGAARRGPAAGGRGGRLSA